MTKEEKAALAAAKAAEKANAISTIRTARQLKPWKQVQELKGDDLDNYEAAASEFVETFNTKYPDGKSVKANIKQITLGERVNIVLFPHDDLSTEVLSFSYAVVDRIAENNGVGDTDGLVALVHQVMEHLQMSLTVKAVEAGDTYEAKDGTREYKCPATVKIEGTREELVLTDEAKDILAEVHKDVLRSKIMEASKNRRKQRTPVRSAKAVTADGAEDDSDV